MFRNRVVNDTEHEDSDEEAYISIFIHIMNNKKTNSMFPHPGAYHIPGNAVPHVASINEATNPHSGPYQINVTEHEDSDEESNISIEQGQLIEDLDSMFPLIASTPVSDDDVIVDGIIVEPSTNPKKHIYMEISLLVLTILPVILFTVTKYPQGVSSMPSMSTTVSLPPTSDKNATVSSMPSMSPTVSLAPTTFYKDYVKQILIPISGEDILDDPTTPQNFAWRKIVFNLPIMLEGSIFELTDTHRIIQQYVIMVITLSLVDDWQNFYDLQINQTCGDECEVFSCNEDKYMTVYIHKNIWGVGGGGGVFAKEIGALPEMTHIVLSKNGLKGSIPTEIGKLKKLHTLDLQNNSFTGPIPTQVGELQNLEWMLLNGNNLTGSVPTAIGNLTRLVYSDLSRNTLIGTIPSEISKLDKLKGMSLSHNSLSGNIDFMCQKNFVNNIFEQQEVIGRSFFSDHAYNYSGIFGLTADCGEDSTLMHCSCCICE